MKLVYEVRSVLRLVYRIGKGGFPSPCLDEDAPTCPLFQTMSLDAFNLHLLGRSLMPPLTAVNALAAVMS